MSLRASGNAAEEMETIQRAANASFLRWSRYPRTVQRALVGNLACRLRHLQDHLGVTGARLDTAFRSLTRFSKSTQPGWVNGLTRGRGPAAESWAEEARCWWDQLVLSAERAVHGGAGAEPLATGPARGEALEAVRGWIDEWRQAPAVAKPMCMEKTLAAIQTAREAGVPFTDIELCRLAGEIYDHLGLPRFRRLRQAIRDLEQAEREDNGTPTTEGLPADWPWWSHTVGRRALLLSTDVAPETAARIEHAFGLASLTALAGDEWAPDPEPIARQLAGAGADLVLVAGEDPDEPLLRAIVRACQVRGLPWVHVEHGLGVIRVRMAIERFLHPDPRGESPPFDDPPLEPGAEE